MRTHSVKAMLAKVVGIGVLAGVAAVAMPQRAEAQSFAVGVQFGGPAYYGYGYGPRAEGYYAHERWEHGRWERERAEAYARQQAWIEHERREAWRAHERHEAYAHGYGYYGPYGR